MFLNIESEENRLIGWSAKCSALFLLFTSKLLEQVQWKLIVSMRIDQYQDDKKGFFNAISGYVSCC